MSRILTPVHKVFSAEALAAGATITSTWVPTDQAARIQVWVNLGSSGSPDTSVVIHMSPLDYTELNKTTCTTEHYEATTVSASLTSTAMKKYDVADQADLGQPAKSARLLFTATGGAAATTVDAYIVTKEG